MHTVYKNAHRETTQWDDAQRKLGNLPPLPPEPVAEKYAPEAEETTANKVDRAQTVDELEELEVVHKTASLSCTPAVARARLAAIRACKTKR